MLEMLEQQYPAQLVPELAAQTQGCLQDCLDAFPNAAAVPPGHLHGLVSAVESLLRISDYQRRRILHHMKKHDRRPERCGQCSQMSMGCDRYASMRFSAYVCFPLLQYHRLPSLLFQPPSTLMGVFPKGGLKSTSRSQSGRLTGPLLLQVLEQHSGAGSSRDIAAFDTICNSVRHAVAPVPAVANTLGTFRPAACHTGAARLCPRPQQIQKVGAEGKRIHDAYSCLMPGTSCCAAKTIQEEVLPIFDTAATRSWWSVNTPACH